MTIDDLVPAGPDDGHLQVPGRERPHRHRVVGRHGDGAGARRADHQQCGWRRAAAGSRRCRIPMAGGRSGSSAPAVPAPMVRAPIRSASSGSGCSQPTGTREARQCGRRRSRPAMRWSPATRPRSRRRRSSCRSTRTSSSSWSSPLSRETRSTRRPRGRGSRSRSIGSRMPPIGSTISSRGATRANLRSVAAWDAASFIRAAKAAGDLDYALAAAVRTRDLEPLWKDTNPAHKYGVCGNPAGCGPADNPQAFKYTILGEGSLLWAIHDLPGFDAQVNEYRAFLLAQQDPAGSWDSGDSQVTSYVTIGLRPSAARAPARRSRRRRSSSWHNSSQPAVGRSRPAAPANTVR